MLSKSEVHFSPHLLSSKITTLTSQQHGVYGRANWSY